MSPEHTNINLTIGTTIPTITRDKKIQSKNRKLSQIDSLDPQATQIHVYSTDDSITDSIHTCTR